MVSGAARHPSPTWSRHDHEPLAGARLRAPAHRRRRRGHQDRRRCRRRRRADPHVDPRPSPAGDAPRTLDAVLDAVRELRATYEVLAVGVAAAGFVDAERAVVMFAPNLAWRDEPLRDEIEQRTGLPVVVENDANAVAWAEARFGAGRGESHLVALTVGTGIGGGVVVDGGVQRGRFGAAAEVGHVVMVPGGRPCPCGLQGCLEQYASGNALLRRAQEVATTSPVLASDLLARAGGRTDHIEGWMVTEAARAGDVAALQVLRRGRGLARSRHRPARRGPRPRHRRPRRRGLRGRRPPPRARPRRLRQEPHRTGAPAVRCASRWPSSAPRPGWSAWPTWPATWPASAGGPRRGSPPERGCQASEVSGCRSRSSSSTARSVSCPGRAGGGHVVIAEAGRPPRPPGAPERSR